MIFTYLVLSQPAQSLHLNILISTQVISDAAKDIHPIYWARRGVKDTRRRRSQCPSDMATTPTTVKFTLPLTFTKHSTKSKIEESKNPVLANSAIAIRGLRKILEI
jgi:hypothetical protein